MRLIGLMLSSKYRLKHFVLPSTNFKEGEKCQPYLPVLPSCKASPPFGWYSLHLPTKGWPGWVDLGGWLHTEINVPHRELNPDTVTHPSY